MASGNTVYESRGSNAVIEKDTDTLVVGCNGTQIPDSVTSIGDNAFAWTPYYISYFGNNLVADDLTSITIPDSVTKIGSGAFTGRHSMVSVKMPDSVTEVGSGAFVQCINLSDVTIPKNLTYISDEMFADCWSLSDITIPDSVTKIGLGAFSGCSNLVGIMIPDSVTSIGVDAFLDVPLVYYSGTATGGPGVGSSPWGALEVRPASEAPNAASTFIHQRLNNVANRISLHDLLGN